MNKAERNKPKTKFGGYVKYVHQKEQYSKHTFRINPDGIGVWLLDGKEVSDREFKELYPIVGIIKRGNTELIDGRSNIFYS